MRYTFLLYSDPADFAHMGPEDFGKMKTAYVNYIMALQEAGVFLDTDRLHAPNSATTVSLKGGEKSVQDGPVAETRETLGGYFVIDVPDLDAALKWAEKCPAAEHGKVEIRASSMDEV